MEEKELNQFFIKTLNDALELFKESLDYEKKNFGTGSEKLIEEYNSIIFSLEEILSKIKSVDDLELLGEDSITIAFEAIAAFAECFVISADLNQRKKDFAQYEKIEELLYLFCDADEDGDEEN